MCLFASVSIVFSIVSFVCFLLSDSIVGIGLAPVRPWVACVDGDRRRGGGWKGTEGHTGEASSPLHMWHGAYRHDMM